jgi:hypothetical protein
MRGAAGAWLPRTAGEASVEPSLSSTPVTASKPYSIDTRMKITYSALAIAPW